MRTLIRNLVRHSGFDLVRYPDPVEPKIDVLDIVFEYVSSRMSDFFFIQIGANDGITGDPLRPYILRHHWRGILIEPEPTVFRKLVGNYETEKQLIFENIAIARRDGSVRLYSVEDPGHSAWEHVLTSFNRDHIIRALGRHTRIKEFEIPALSFSSLLAKHDVARIDLLQIDVEGFDYEILNMIDFNDELRKPGIINYEHMHMRGNDRRESWRRLAAAGYRLWATSTDTLAVLPERVRGEHAAGP